MIQRRDFLFAAAAAGLTPAVLGAAPNASDEEAVSPLGRALVLSGGGARGAYEAGLVGALAARTQDGAPLPGYDLVCGTSIGALNGWFVATGQYSKMKSLWYGVSGQGLVQAKRQFAALQDPDSGLFNRAASALELMGLTKSDKAVLDTQAVYEWIARHIDPATPLLVPLIWAVTNLTQQRPEYFYLRPQGAPPDLPQRVVHALQLLLGPHTVVREATADNLHKAIFASAALPLAFDPVLMPGPDGVMNAYCDGGVASNSPVGIAHAVSKAADVVLLDPPFQPETSYDSAVDIAFGIYGTMQRKILEVEMRSTYFQSIGKRAYAGRARQTSLTSDEDALLDTFMKTVISTELRYIRPKKTLPVTVVGFNDEVGIGKAYRIGWEDASRDFTKYDWRTFEL
ncbi:MAG TPA: patatin-like phospholipase family protein [Candidatus Tumulicola sp.]